VEGNNEPRLQNPLRLEHPIGNNETETKRTNVINFLITGDSYNIEVDCQKNCLTGAIVRQKGNESWCPNADSMMGEQSKSQKRGMMIYFIMLHF
jgi:hypothetical protein